MATPQLETEKNWLANLGESGRATLLFATEEAARLNHNYIGTEHLLLGLGTRNSTRDFRNDGS